MLNPKIASAKSIPEAYEVAAEIFTDRAVLRFKTSPTDKYSGKYTFAEFTEAMRIAATALAEDFGLKPDQKIGFISENRPEYNIGDAAVMCAGGVSWGLYDYDVKSPEVIEYKLSDSGSEIIMTSPTFLESVRAVVRGGKTPLKKIIIFDMPHDKIEYGENEFAFSDILESGEENKKLIKERLAPAGRDTVARLIYTSGTTGMPKGVMLTHGNLLSNVEESGKLLNLEPGERMISYLPEAHSYQGYLSVSAILSGVQMWYSHKKSILEDIAVIEPTLFPGVPLVYKRFAEGMREKVLTLTKGFIDLAEDYSKKPIKNFIRLHILGPKALKKVGLGKVKNAVSGSAKLDAEHQRILSNIGFTIFEGYGISETSPVISCESEGRTRRGSVGKAIPNCDVKIISLDEEPGGARRELPAGEQGEVIIKGPQVFKGYYNHPEKTKKSFYKGYYLTGDRGHLDKDGFLYIHGRCGLQVKMANGEFVDLDELSANILRCTTLVQAAAVDAELKEFAVAVVSLQWEPEALNEVGKKLGVPFTGDAKEFARNEKVINAIKKELDEVADKIGSPRSPMTPKKYLIVAPMSPETGEITSTMKFRIRNILAKYQEQITALRASNERFMIYIQ